MRNEARIVAIHVHADAHLPHYAQVGKPAVPGMSLDECPKSLVQPGPAVNHAWHTRDYDTSVPGCM